MQILCNRYKEKIENPLLKMLIYDFKMCLSIITEKHGMDIIYERISTLF